MHTFQKTSFGIGLTSLLALGTLAAHAATPAATYEFNNTLAADQGGVPTLTATDPLASNGFETDTVFGQTRTVYFTSGTTPPAQQAGLTLNTTGLLTPNNYSVRTVFSFSDRLNGYRRILDVQNRQSDAGFYVDPSNNLDLYPVSGSSTAFTNDVYHDVVLTESSTGVVTAYLDGVLQINTPSTLMDINNANNPTNLLNFYLDNTIAGGQGEFSNAKTALISVYDSVLTAQDVASLNGTLPGAVVTATPEPASTAAFSVAGLGLAALLFTARRRKVSDS